MKRRSAVRCAAIVHRLMLVAASGPLAVHPSRARAEAPAPSGAAVAVTQVERPPQPLSAPAQSQSSQLRLTDYLCSDTAYVRLAPGPRSLLDWCFALWDNQVNAKDAAGAEAAADCVDALLDDPAVSLGRAQLRVAAGDLAAGEALLRRLEEQLVQPGACARPNRAEWIDAQLRQLRLEIRRRAEQHAASLRVLNVAPDTAVELDGVPVDAAALARPLTVPPGAHQVTLLRQGRPVYRAELHLAPDERREVDARLPPVVSPRAELLATRQRAHTAAWVLTGTGAALGVTGLALGLAANSLSVEADEYVLNAPGNSVGDRFRLDEEAGRYAVAANALFAAAAFFVGGALASWWLAPADEPTVTLSAAPDTAQLKWRITW